MLPNYARSITKIILGIAICFCSNLISLDMVGNSFQLPNALEVQRLRTLALQSSVDLLIQEPTLANPEQFPHWWDTEAKFYRSFAVNVFGGRIHGWCTFGEITVEPGQASASMSRGQCSRNSPSLFIHTRSSSRGEIEIILQTLMPGLELARWTDEISKMALRRFLNAFDDEDPLPIPDFSRMMSQIEAAGFLAMAGDNDALKFLLQSVGDEFLVHSVMSFIAWTSMKYPKVMVPILRDLLLDERAYVRWGAVFGISNLGDNVIPLIPILVDIMKSDPAYHIREIAALVLGMIGHESAVPALIDVLKSDGIEEIRINAARALGMIGDSRAIDVLINFSSLRGSLLQHEAIMALASVGANEEIVLQTLRDELLHGEIDPVRASAGLALAIMNDTENISSIIDLLKSSSSVARSRAASALGRLKAVNAVPALLEALAVEDSVETKQIIMSALANIDDESAIPALINEMNGEDAENSLVAALALSSMGEAKIAVPKLIELLGSETPFMARMVASLMTFFAHMDPEFASISFLRLLEADVDQDMFARVHFPLMTYMTVVNADPTQIRFIREHSDHENARIRAQVASFLGFTINWANRSERMLLLQALDDESPNVRAAAVRAVAIQYIRSLDSSALRRVEELISDEHKLVQLRATESLLDALNWIAVYERIRQDEEYDFAETYRNSEILDQSCLLKQEFAALYEKYASNLAQCAWETEFGEFISSY